MKMMAENLAYALRYAIYARRKEERNDLGYTRDSILVAGWEIILRALESGEQVQTIESAYEDTP